MRKPQREDTAASPLGSFKLVPSNSVYFLLKAALSESGGRVRCNPQYCWWDSCVHTVCCTCTGDLYFARAVLSLVSHNTLACHNSPWGVLKEVILLVLKFKVYFIKEIQGYSYSNGNRSLFNHLYSQRLERKRWSPSGVGEKFVHMCLLCYCLIVWVPWAQSTDLHILDYVWSPVLRWHSLFLWLRGDTGGSEPLIVVLTLTLSNFVASGKSFSFFWGVCVGTVFSSEKCSNWIH